MAIVWTANIVNSKKLSTYYDIVKKKFRLINDQSISDITAVMVAVLALDKEHTVEICEYKETRTSRQRKR